MEPKEPLVSLTVLLKPLKSLTIFFFFSGAGLLLLALCLAAIDVGDGLFWVVAGLAVLVPLASLGDTPLLHEVNELGADVFRTEA